MSGDSVVFADSISSAVASAIDTLPVVVLIVSENISVLFVIPVCVQLPVNFTRVFLISCVLLDVNCGKLKASKYGNLLAPAVVLYVDISCSGEPL